jgi:bifunctional DNA-binding transcriptional regulator/antitoxin component of YhaV-PrlF toxin-antitoxin module
MPKVTALTIGGSGFVAFPQEILDRLQVRAGDELVVTETKNGYHIARFDPEREKAPSADSEVP